METGEKYIELFPGNWLQNAAVVGFLISLERIENKDAEEFLPKDGRFIFPLKYFKQLKVAERYFDKVTQISSIVAKAPIYRNYLQSSEKDVFHLFVEYLEKLQNVGKCDVMSNNYNLTKSDVIELKRKGLEKFIERIEDFNMIFQAALGPSMAAFPNAYWNLNNSLKVSHLFAFLIIHHHLPFTKLSDGTKIFINAPSFKLMYLLNQLVSNLASKGNTSYRSLLAMSIVEFSVRTKILLDSWANMNIEIVAQKGDAFDFVSLPYKVVRIIANKRIAGIISDIGDFGILEKVINQKWDSLVETGYRLLKISLNGIGKEDQGFLSSFYFQNRGRDVYKIKILANKILKLYSLLDEQTKKLDYEWNN